MYADPSKLAEEVEKDSFTELRRRAKRIFNLATLGFKQTLDNNLALNRIFLRVLIESNKLYNELGRYVKQG